MGKTFIWDHEKNGVINMNFKIFIVDFAQANFNIVGILFRSGDPNFPMEH
jgi:hypothetical protein